MADSNIKKVVVPQADIPSDGYEKSQHQLRFRITSEDKTRFSHWSPFFLIDNDGIDTTPGFIEITDPVVPDPPEPPDPEDPDPPPPPPTPPTTANFVDLVWQTPKPRSRRYRYDIFVRWMTSPLGETDFETYPFELLSSRYTGNSIKIKVEETVLSEQSLYARVIVQLAQSTKRTPTVSRRPIYDSGDISLIVDES